MLIFWGEGRNRFSRFVTLNNNAKEVLLPIKYKINRHAQKGHISFAPNIAFNVQATWLTFMLVFLLFFPIRLASSSLVAISWYQFVISSNPSHISPCIRCQVISRAISVLKINTFFSFQDIEICFYLPFRRSSLQIFKVLYPSYVD